MKKFNRFIIVLLAVIALSVSVCVNAAERSLSASRNESDILGSWETLVDIDGIGFITRAELEADKSISLKLCDTAGFLGYSILWNANLRTVRLYNDVNDVTIFIDKNYFEREGKMVKLTRPVYISDGRSYISEEFIGAALDINVAKINSAAWNNRINGVTLEYKDNFVRQPEMPISSETVEPSAIIDGKALYINYFSALKPMLPADTVVSLCQSGGREQVLIYSDGEIKDLKIVSVSFNDFGKDLIFSSKEILHEQAVLKPGLAVLLNTYVPEGIPTQAVSVTDSKGSVHSFLLSYSGKDGSVIANTVELK